MKKRKYSLIVLVLVLVLVFVAGCRSFKFDEGVVIERVYEPPRTWIMFIPTPMGETTMLIPHYFTDGADYILKVKGDYSDGGEIKQVVEKVYVSSEDFYSISVGDRVVLDKKKHRLKDFNNSKRRK